MESHYNRNKEYYLAKNKQVRERNKKFVRDYKLKHPCVDCGESNPIVLDFDHVRGQKEYEINNMCRHSYSLESLRNEIAKCEIRCANCHRIKTYYADK